nr:MAG TPA: hypothetical protein [Caudoviricetes sp.]
MGRCATVGRIGPPCGWRHADKGGAVLSEPQFASRVFVDDDRSHLRLLR